MTPDAWLGRVKGSTRLLGNVLGGTGALLAAGLASTGDVRAALLVATGVTLSGFLVLLLSRPARRQRLVPAVDLVHFDG